MKSNTPTKESLTIDLKRLMKKCEDEGKYSIAIGAVKVLANIWGLDNGKIPDENLLGDGKKQVEINFIQNISEEKQQKLILANKETEPFTIEINNDKVQIVKPEPVSNITDLTFQDMNTTENNTD
jgi:hypothetical protein